MSGLPYVSDPDFTLYVGDVRDVLRELEPESVDCVVTSPPYWGLRDYGTEGNSASSPPPRSTSPASSRSFGKCGGCWLRMEPPGSTWGIATPRLSRLTTERRTSGRNLRRLARSGMG